MTPLHSQSCVIRGNRASAIDNCNDFSNWWIYFAKRNTDRAPLDTKAWRYQLNAIGCTIIHSFRKYKSACESAQYNKNISKVGHSLHDNLIVITRDGIKFIVLIITYTPIHLSLHKYS